MCDFYIFHQVGYPKNYADNNNQEVLPHLVPDHDMLTNDQTQGRMTHCLGEDGARQGHEDHPNPHHVKED